MRTAIAVALSISLLGGLTSSALADPTPVESALEGLVTSQAKEIELQKKQITTATMALSLTTYLAQEEKSRGDDLAKLSTRQADQIEAMSSWTHSPLLWVSVGAVGAVLLGALVLSHSSPTVNVTH